jgi:hypothetical protein
MSQSTLLPIAFCPLSMGGQLHTAEAYAKGVRSLRERVGAKWISPGNDWTSLPLVLARSGGRLILLDADSRGLGLSRPGSAFGSCLI